MKCKYKKDSIGGDVECKFGNPKDSTHCLVCSIDEQTDYLCGYLGDIQLQLEKIAKE